MDDKTYRARDWSQQPPYLYPDYQSTALRSPAQPLVALGETLSERTGPAFGADAVDALDSDLTRNGVVDGEPLGERIIVTGRVLDEDGSPIPETLVEIWQCNAAGRYIHEVDQHDAPLDPNFFGAGRFLTDGDGRYRFTSIRPGCYPWQNHPKAFRPAHIHFSLFGPSFLTRLVTQMYFPGDPLFQYDPIYNSAPEGARERLVSKFALDLTEPEFALGYEFDFVLRGRNATPMEN